MKTIGNPSVSFLESVDNSRLHAFKAEDPKRLKEACQGMESLFINMMLKEMRKSIPNSGLFPRSLQEDIYTSLFDQQVAQVASEKGKGIGIADMLFEYLSRQNAK